MRRLNSLCFGHRAVPVNLGCRRIVAPLSEYDLRYSGAARTWMCQAPTNRPMLLPLQQSRLVHHHARRYQRPSHGPPCLHPVRGGGTAGRVFLFALPVAATMRSSLSNATVSTKTPLSTVACSGSCMLNSWAEISVAYTVMPFGNQCLKAKHFTAHSRVIGCVRIDLQFCYRCLINFSMIRNSRLALPEMSPPSSQQFSERIGLGVWIVSEECDHEGPMLNAGDASTDFPVSVGPCANFEALRHILLSFPQGAPPRSEMIG